MYFDLLISLTKYIFILYLFYITIEYFIVCYKVKHKLNRLQNKNKIKIIN